MNKTLNKINNILNKANPSRMKPVNGCLVLNDVIGEVVELEGVYSDQNKGAIDYNPYLHKTIIGQKPTVLEVVEYLTEKFVTKDRNCFNFNTSYNASGTKQKILTINKQEYGGDFGFIDITLKPPYLIADLPEQTQKQLLELMEK